MIVSFSNQESLIAFHRAIRMVHDLVTHLQSLGFFLGGESVRVLVLLALRASISAHMAFFHLGSCIACKKNLGFFLERDKM